MSLQKIKIKVMNKSTIFLSKLKNNPLTPFFKKIKLIKIITRKRRKFRRKIRTRIRKKIRRKVRTRRKKRIRRIRIRKISRINLQFNNNQLYPYLHSRKLIILPLTCLDKIIIQRILVLVLILMLIIYLLIIC